MQWMMKKENQIRQHLTGGASALLTTYENPDVMKLTYTETSLESMKYGIPKPTIPESVQIFDILARELSECLVGRKSARKALDDAAIDFNKLLGDKSKLVYEPAK